MIETVDSEAFSEAQEGMQCVNGKGWVQAEKAFLDSFDSAPPRLRRLDPGPPPLPDIVLPGLARPPSVVTFCHARNWAFPWSWFDLCTSVLHSTAAHDDVRDIV